MGNAGVLDDIRQLFEGVTPRELRAIGLQSLRQWRQRAREPENFVPLGDFGTDFITGLAEAGKIPVDVARVRDELFTRGGEQATPFRSMVDDFIWWLIRAGLARPGSHDAVLTAIWISAAGLRFLDAVGDHPLAPGFLSRLRQRHPDIPEAIVLLLEDAQACLEADLLRPAVVLLGVAFEAAVEAVLHNLATKGLLEARDLRKGQAGERIGLLLKQINSLKLNPDPRREIEEAIAFADHLRERRNDAAHTTPKWPFDDHDELEELLVSGARHLPVLWGMTTAPTLAGG